jgi:rod shape-determining protein MreC
LITDQQFRAGARTLESRTPGIIMTRAGNPDDLILGRTLRTDVVQKGETVLTAGTTSTRDDLESPFPPDLPIGRVTHVDEAGTDAQVVHVRPFVDLRRINFAEVLTQRVNGNRGRG